MAKNILLTVINPNDENQPAFDRGLDSARDMGWGLHLYACATPNTGVTTLEEAEAKVRPLLDGLADQAQNAGVAATTELEVGSDWAAQAVAAAARVSAALIFNNSIDHSSVQRESRPTSDWTLMRLSPCPVLLIKNYHDWKNRKVLGAIKFDSTEAAHIKLNHAVISRTMAMAEGYGADAHFVAAFQDLNHAPDTAELAQTCGVDESHIHAVKGPASQVIRDTAEELDADLIIIGTVARDGIKGRVIGNTCERLLDQTHSDILVLN